MVDQRKTLELAGYQREVAEKGYTVLRNALTVSETEFLRDICLKYFDGGRFIYFQGGKARPNAFSESALHEIQFLLHKRTVIDVINVLCGGNARYCDHSDVFLNVNTGWHHDNMGIGTSYQYGQDSYGIYKVAVYLQDHTKDAGALRVREGSHKNSSSDDCSVKEIYTNVGDVIIFDLRLAHSGTDFVTTGSLLDRISRRIRRNLKSEKATFRFRECIRRAKGASNKLAIFYVFGKNNQLTREHMEAIRQRNRELGVTHRDLPHKHINALPEMSNRSSALSVIPKVISRLR